MNTLPRYDRRETSHAFFANLLERANRSDDRLVVIERRVESIERGIWCIVKTIRIIGGAVFAAVLVVLPEFGKTKGWW